MHDTVLYPIDRNLVTQQGKQKYIESMPHFPINHHNLSQNRLAMLTEWWNKSGNTFLRMKLTISHNYWHEPSHGVATSESIKYDTKLPP